MDPYIITPPMEIVHQTFPVKLVNCILELAKRMGEYTPGIIQTSLDIERARTEIDVNPDDIKSAEEILEKENIRNKSDLELTSVGQPQQPAAAPPEEEAERQRKAAAAPPAEEKKDEKKAAAPATSQVIGEDDPRKKLFLIIVIVLILIFILFV